MGKDFKITITNEERKKDFIKVFGSDTICVQSPIPTLVKIENTIQEVYFLDLNSITNEQTEKLISHISEKFKQSEQFVRKNLDLIGLPILKKDSMLIIENPQRWFD